MSGDVSALVKDYARRRYRNRLDRAVDLGIINRAQAILLVEMWEDEYAEDD